MDGKSEFLVETGLRAQQAGNLRGAIDAFQTALAQSPKSDKILFLLGNSHLQQGDISNAVQCLEQAYALRRNHPAILGSLAQAYFEAGRSLDAENLFRKAIRIDPRAPQFQLGLATALATQGKFADAETLLKRLVDRHPDSGFAWFNLGNVARDQQRADDAISHYRKAIACDANLIDARNNLGSVLHATLRFDEAQREYRACIAADSDYIPARTNLASVLIDMGRFDEAETACRDTLRIAPDYPSAHSMLGAALAAQGKLHEALQYSRKAAELAPEELRFVETHAVALCEVGETEEGLIALGKILRADANSLTARRLVSSALLSAGYFSEGWDAYRQRTSFQRTHDKYPQLNLTQTLPQQLDGKQVGIVREQGLGDELFFLRFVPQLALKGVHVTYFAGSKISGMLERVPEIGRVVTSIDALPAADANMLVGDLPYALADSPSLDLLPAAHDASALLTTFPWQHSPYAPLPPRSLAIAPLESALDRIKERLHQIGKPPYFGVTWRGGTPPHEQQGAEWKLFKAITIADIASAMQGLPGTVLALQRNPLPDELAALESTLGVTVHDFTPLNDELEDMLALLFLIDEYIGVSNTNMHLRAAAGKTARVLVPCPAEWRWMAQGDASPWFPGFGVYRQSMQGSWDDALSRLRHDLAAAYGKRN